MADAILDGLPAAVLSSLVSVGLALYVLHRSLAEGRALSTEQRATDAALLAEQHRSNTDLSRQAQRAQTELAHELASLDSARECARSGARLSAGFALYRSRLIEAGPSELRKGLRELGAMATNHAEQIQTHAPGITDVDLAQHLLASLRDLDDRCEQITNSAVAYEGASDRPDSAEAASLTSKHRAWQQYTGLLASVAYELQNAAAAATGYISGRPAPGPAAGAEPFRGIAGMQAWAGAD